MSHTFPICSDEVQLFLKVPVDRGSVQHVNEFLHPLLLRNIAPRFVSTWHMVPRAYSNCVLNFASFYLC
jgi:hypothetical protein